MKEHDVTSLNVKEELEKKRDASVKGGELLEEGEASTRGGFVYGGWTPHRKRTQMDRGLMSPRPARLQGIRRSSLMESEALPKRLKEDAFGRTKGVGAGGGSRTS